ncbi:hypothetical protein BGZ61DRAFT_539114 [Ilyonectria robusta]|uniref:uncharacterized protein n=1 Tax=Ilyonectria robusta TaxID=1079257 RepID=UPI001E8E35B8|nr:uncharacterized protein BGZ61DRAFT_539114 [Ilyonectria robusta]KAH8663809.1 hypothetical protein BGZ61DRAFT_539114 [Ilyonectria robusta]
MFLSKYPFYLVQFGGEDLKLGIYGIATLDASSSLSKDEFAHVELGIVVALDIEAGVFKLESQLSPRSFVLAEVCPVAGVIAFYSWFKADTSKNIVAGDWVLSLGGYHQAFKAPANYPRPPRLGINWSLDASLRITGVAYFAITPKICMGGGRLHVALSLGKLYVMVEIGFNQVDKL